MDTGNGEANRLHVLVLPSWVSGPEFPMSGVFFMEQAQALAKYGLEVGYVCVGQRRRESSARPMSISK